MVVAYKGPSRLLIVNFGGLGNGVWILPLLKRLEEVAPNISYFHVENPIFETPDFLRWFDLKNFLGTFPGNWRRFGKDDLAEIKTFIVQNKIDVIVNLRNEGPRRDVGYIEFMNEMIGTEIDFWHLDHERIETRIKHRHLIEDQVELFRSRGIDLSSVNSLWLRDYLTSRHNLTPTAREIGFFTGASQNVKTWPAENWIALGRRLLAESDFGITVFAGLSKREIDFAESVWGQLSIDFPGYRCKLVANRPLDLLCSHLSCLALLISNDTSCVHLGAALGIDVIGLYFSTDSTIWGGLTDRFTAVQSKSGLACGSFKRDAGNCLFYYGDCPAPCKNEVTVQRVFQVIERLEFPDANFRQSGIKPLIPAA